MHCATLRSRLPRACRCAARARARCSHLQSKMRRSGLSRILIECALWRACPALLDTAPESPRPPTRRFLLSVAEILTWHPQRGVGAATMLDLETAPPLPPPTQAEGRGTTPRVLHCHDMAGGYNDRADGEYLEAFESCA
eukprot:SAG11_NODE_2636_length_3149_cov_1.681639_5_plen_139_part_00